MTAWMPVVKSLNWPFTSLKICSSAADWSLSSWPRKALFANEPMNCCAQAALACAAHETTLLMLAVLTAFAASVSAASRYWRFISVPEIAA